MNKIGTYPLSYNPVKNIVFPLKHSIQYKDDLETMIGLVTNWIFEELDIQKSVTGSKSDKDKFSFFNVLRVYKYNLITTNNWKYFINELFVDTAVHNVATRLTCLVTTIMIQVDLSSISIYRGKLYYSIFELANNEIDNDLKLEIVSHGVWWIIPLLQDVYELLLLKKKVDTY